MDIEDNNYLIFEVAMDAKVLWEDELELYKHARSAHRKVAIDRGIKRANKLLEIINNQS